MKNENYQKLDRFTVKFKSLKERKNRKVMERDLIPLSRGDELNDSGNEVSEKVLKEVVGKIKVAKELKKPVILTFGAHAIKNCLAPVFIDLMRGGWITHLATNGAGIIHDWEFSYQGESSEDVRENVRKGEFGNWEETGFYLNLSFVVGAFYGMGYGESIGCMVENEGLNIPSDTDLNEAISHVEKDYERAATAIDLLRTKKAFKIPDGFMKIPHRFKKYGIQREAYRLRVPFTGHPMFGHDIIYNHPMNCGSAIGRTAERDFLIFADAVSHLENGVFLSVGSAVMAPMIFEKSMSMAQNLARQKGKCLDNHYMLIVDLQESNWDWTKGEPPEDNPDYYLRFNKSFSRMGGEMRYLSMDNRQFLLQLHHLLKE